MGLLRLAAVAAGGYYVYNRLRRHDAPRATPVAFADGETAGPNFAKVRNAGPDAMRSDVKHWDKVDEAADESFPASDPPSMP